MGTYDIELHLYPETFIVVGVILTPLVGVLLSFYINNVIDIAYQVERGGLSYRLALWTHTVLGMGLFYVDREARRKWLYAFIALLISLLVLTQIFYETTSAITIGRFQLQKMAEGRVDAALEVALWIALGLHILSFVDVLGTCYVRRRNYRGVRKDIRHAEPTQSRGTHQPPRIRKSTRSGELPRWLVPGLLSAGIWWPL